MTTAIDTARGPSSDNHIDFKTCCLFCYKNLSRETQYQRPPSEFDDKFEEVERFFKLLSRHLSPGPDRGSDNEAINLEAVTSAVLRGGHGGGIMDLCKECGEVVHTFCEAYHRMKVAELEVDAKLWELTTRMTTADKVRSEADYSVKREEEGSSLLETMRGDVLRKCHRRFENTLPRPLLTKCDASPTEAREPKRFEIRLTIEDPSHNGKTDPVSFTREGKQYKCLKCLHCSNWFRTSRSLNNHSQTVHVDKFLLAHKAEGTSDEAFAKIVSDFTTRMTLNKTCHVCERHFGQRQTAVRHLVQQHSQRVSLELGRLQENSNKLPTSVPPRDYWVEKAPRETVPTTTVPSRHRCIICGKVFPSSTKLQSHVWTHSGGKSFSCTYCDSSFRNRLNRQVHEVKVHPERVLVTFRAVDMSIKDFRKRLRQVFGKLLVQLDKGKRYECQCCRRTFGARAKGEYHVVNEHRKYFSHSIRGVQAEPSIPKVEGTGKQEIHQRFIQDNPGLPENNECPSSIVSEKTLGVTKARRRPKKKRPHAVYKRYTCWYCVRTFADLAGRRNHALLTHPHCVLASYKLETTSRTDFRAGIEKVFEALMTSKMGGRRFLCNLCQMEFWSRPNCEQHVIKIHPDRFSEDILACQQGSSYLSSPLLSLESVDSLRDAHLVDADSVPIAFLVPKTEVEVVDDEKSIIIPEEDSL